MNMIASLITQKNMKEIQEKNRGHTETIKEINLKGNQYTKMMHIRRPKCVLSLKEVNAEKEKIAILLIVITS